MAALVEDTALRTLNGKVWKKPDGNVAYSEHGCGLHYLDAAGNITDADYTLRNRAAGDLASLWRKVSFARWKVGFLQSIGDAGWACGLKTDGLNGKAFKLAPRAYGFIQKSTKAMQFIATSPLPATGEVEESKKDGSRVIYRNVFDGIDLTYEIGSGRFNQLFTIHSWSQEKPLTWDAEDTGIFFATEIDFAGKQLAIKAAKDNGASEEWVGGDIFDIRNINIEGDKTERIQFNDDYARRYNKGLEEKDGLARIVKFLVKKNIGGVDRYFLVEIVPYNFIAKADFSLPVIVDYTTHTGTETANQSWSDTHYLSGNYTLSTFTLTWAAGTVCKCASTVVMTFNNTGNWTVNGTTANPCYMVGANDDTVGETIAGSTGSASVYWGNVTWTRTAAATDTISNLYVRQCGNGQTSAFLNTGTGPTTWTFTNIVFEENYINFGFIRTNAAMTAITCTGLFIWNNHYNGYGLYLNGAVTTVTFTHGYINCYIGFDILVANTVTISNIICEGAYGGAFQAVKLEIGGATVNCYNLLAQNYQSLVIYNSFAGATTLNLYDSIVLGNFIGIGKANAAATMTSDYCCVHANNTNYGGASVPAAGANSILTDPVFAVPQIWPPPIKMNGVAFPADISVCLLNAATSPCYRTGSRTVAAAGLTGMTCISTGAAAAAGDTVSMGAYVDAFGGPDFSEVANTRNNDTTNGVSGTCTIPAAGDYKAGAQCGAAGTEVTGTRTDADPAAVLDTEPTYGDPDAPLTPSFDLAAAGLAFEAGRNTAADPTKYELAATFDQFGVPVVGTFDEASRNTNPGEANVSTLAGTYKILNITKTPTLNLAAENAAYEAGRNTAIDPADVRDGEDIHQFGTHDTGTYSISIPSTPTLTVASDGTGTSFTATIDGDSGATNYIYYKRPTDTAWTLGGSRSGDGAIQVTSLIRAFYEVYAVSKTGDSYSAPSLVVPVYVDTTAATAYIVQIMEAVRDTLNAAALTDSGGDMITATIAIPPNFEDVSTSVFKIFPDETETEPTHLQINNAIYRINVAICERASTEAARNKNMRNDELLKDMFVGKRIALLPTAIGSAAARSPKIAEMNALWERFQWINVIQFEFEKLRERL